MRCKGMTKRMTGRRLGNAGVTHRRANHSLNGGLVKVMTPSNARARINTRLRGWKYILPSQFMARPRVLARQCIGGCYGFCVQLR
jgi:hypothetical protein